MEISGRIILKSGREGPIRGGNPWIFSQAIAAVEPSGLTAGSGVDVYGSAGILLGYGYFNPATTIAVRMLAFGSDRKPEPDSIVEYRIRNALEFRRHIVSPGTNCYRLINADGDGLSGVVIDRYNDVAVVQLLTAGADRLRDEIVSALNRLITPRAIIERSQGAVRRQEGLDNRDAVLAGETVSETSTIENGIQLIIDLEHGQKTGYFLDQRENRLIARNLAQGKRVLDAYCYAGGFTLAALAGGAVNSVAVDTSARALGFAQRNADLNGYGISAIKFVHDEAARYLGESDTEFDLVVMDPPPLARSLKDAPHAARLYTELNTLAIRSLAPGGYLMTFSCSVHFRGEEFIRAIRIAAANAKRPMRILRHLGAAPDHPVLLGHGEGEYLTGILLADLG